MFQLKNILFITWLVIAIICVITECRRTGGSSTRGYSRPSSPSRPSSSSSGNRDHSSSSGSSNYWQRPSSNTNSHPSPPQSTNYGWQRPNTNTHTNTNPRPDTSNSGSNYGWKKPDAPSNPSSGTNYGWKKPDATNTQTHTQQGSPSNSGGWKKPDSNTNHGSPTNPQSPSYGWKKPDTNQGSPTNPQPSYGWKKPDTPHQPNNVPRKDTQTNVGHSSPPRPGSVGSATGYKHSDAPSANIGPNGYPVQPGHKYNTGYNHGYQQGYQNGYRTGYHQSPAAQPSNYGFSQTYYPQQNHFGYPGQGIYAGTGGPTYGGMHVFGSNGHYGYPTNSMWGYPSYGSGSSGSTIKGVLIGALAGYYVNSLIHRATTPNYWGYSGSGYGSQYSHVTIDKRTFINNHYNNQTTSEKGDGKDSSIPNHWIQCVAFDPTTQSTLINPNCSCTVSVTTDPATNVSSSVHNCSTTYGFQTEKTPTPGRYAPDIETFDVRYATPHTTSPEKYVNGTNTNSVLDKNEQRKREFLEQLQKMVNMGSFVF